MQPQNIHPRHAHDLSRRDLLKAGLAAGAALSTWSLYRVPALWGEAAEPPKRGGILRVRGRDPVHFDPHLTRDARTHSALSFLCSRLLRYKVGGDVRPGTFIVEPDLAERWEEPDDTTYVFHLRRGVKWHNKPPVNGRELVAEDVKFTFDRFLSEKGNPSRYFLDSVDRVEVVDRYTVKFVLHEPFVWLLDMLASATSMWIIAPEVAAAIWRPEESRDRHRHRAFYPGALRAQCEDGVPTQPRLFSSRACHMSMGSSGWSWRTNRPGWRCIAPGRSMPAPAYSGTFAKLTWTRSSRAIPSLRYQDMLANNATTIWMRTDKSPFTDVRVRRAISHAIDRQGVIEAVWMRGELSPAVPRGLAEWSLPIDQLGEGAKYYRYDPQEARRLLAEAGYAKGFKTTLNATGGYGRDMLDAVQMVQRYLKEVGIEVELKIQEYGAYQATTGQGKFEGLAMGPYALGWEADSSLYGQYMPDQLRNRGHVNDPKLAAMLKEQRRIKDLEARKQLIFDIQRYAAEQQYYVYLSSQVITASWQPYMKNFAPNLTADFGSRAAALWLDR